MVSISPISFKNSLIKKSSRQSSVPTTVKQPDLNNEQKELIQNVQKEPSENNMRNAKIVSAAGAVTLAASAIYYGIKRKPTKEIKHQTGEITNYTVAEFKKAGHKIKKLIAQKADDSNYTGTITTKKGIILNYDDGLLLQTTNSKGEIRKQYFYDTERNIVAIADGHNDVLLTLGKNNKQNLSTGELKLVQLEDDKILRVDSEFPFECNYYQYDNSGKLKTQIKTDYDTAREINEVSQINSDGEILRYSYPEGTGYDSKMYTIEKIKDGKSEKTFTYSENTQIPIKGEYFHQLGIRSMTLKTIVMPKDIEENAIKYSSRLLPKDFEERKIEILSGAYKGYRAENYRDYRINNQNPKAPQIEKIDGNLWELYSPEKELVAQFNTNKKEFTLIKGEESQEKYLDILNNILNKQIIMQENIGNMHKTQHSANDIVYKYITEQVSQSI